MEYCGPIFKHPYEEINVFWVYFFPTNKELLLL